MILRSCWCRNNLLRILHVARPTLCSSAALPKKTVPFLRGLLSKSSLRRSSSTLAPSNSLLPAPVLSGEEKKQLEVQKRVWEEAHEEGGGPWLEKFIPVTRQGLLSKLTEETEMLSPEEPGALCCGARRVCLSSVLCPTRADEG